MVRLVKPMLIRDGVSRIVVGLPYMSSSSTMVLRIPGGIAERLEREAKRLGISLEEYVLELVLGDLDPPERAREYIEAAKTLLEQAAEELQRGDVRQAAEKTWGATALTVKAYAAWKHGRRLTSHGELWKYKRIMARELGKWVSDAWYAGQTMHICFYEAWCTQEDVEEAIERINKLVKEVEKLITHNHHQQDT